MSALTAVTSAPPSASALPATLRPRPKRRHED